jgi:hypothetical protein
VDGFFGAVHLKRIQEETVAIGAAAFVAVGG